MKHAAIVYFDAGSGHRSAARGLAQALRAARPGWRVSAVDLLDVLAPHPWFRRIVQTGINQFNRQLIAERVFGLGGLVNLSLLCHDLLRPAGIARIAEYWRAAPPDAVVSVTPMYNPVLYRSARLANPDVRCITIPVDFEEFKRRYWFTPRVEQHYLVATDRLEWQARAAKIPPGLVERIPGMIIDPAFYSPPPADIPAELARLGLDPARPTGLVSFGGQGSVVVLEIARRLAAVNAPYNMIFLCGRNRASFEAVRNLPTSYPKLALGYADEPPQFYLHLADVAIGKPGSMTITEALVTHTPFVFIKSRGLAPVQRGNEAWVLAHGVGNVAPDVTHLPDVMAELLASPAYRANARTHSHRGIFVAAERVAALVEAVPVSAGAG
ncbi:MAG TPA: glycosyltransferase [Thermomicrobiaceae bacterium]|nr:glycosyltransferase [Thermomicrobiaceae bacterium]